MYYCKTKTMGVTITTVDGVARTYPVDRVRTCSQYVVIADNDSISTPANSEEFYLMDIYLRGESVTDTITKDTLSDVSKSIAFTLTIAPDSFLNDISNCIVEILYNTFENEYADNKQDMQKDIPVTLSLIEKLMME
jgi:hypothetical protein